MLDSKTIEVDRNDAVALRDSLSHEISLFLRQRLGREIREQQTRGLTRDAMAWELLLRARATAAGIDALLAAADTTGGLKELDRADSLLALASIRDRRWIAPVLERGWLAHASRRLAPPFDKTYGAKWTATALAFAEEARRIDPEDVETLRLRGTARYMQFLLNIDASRQPSEQLLASAEADLRAAAAPANPNQASAWALLSHLLMRKGETAAGKLAALRAYEADPYLAEAPTVLWRLTNASLDLQDATEADRWCREGARRFAADPFFLECQISVEALPGRRPDVQRLWKLYERLVSLHPAGEREFRSRRTALLVAMGLVRAGLADSARAVALRARTDATVDPARDLLYVEILLRNLLGDREEALRLVGEYLATNPQDRSTMARDSTWWLRGLRDDPRFRALVGTG